jgi:hypothetical protein
MLAQLDALGFHPAGAAWVYSDDAELWRLRIATPLVDKPCNETIYRELFGALASQGLPDGIDWKDFGLMSTHRALYKGFPHDARPDAPIAVDYPDPYSNTIRKAVVYRALPFPEADEDHSADFLANVRALKAA